MGFANEHQVSHAAKSSGVWHQVPIYPSSWFEASANIAVSVPATGLGPTLTFAAAASTTDIAINRLQLPANFKKDMNTSPAKLLFEVSVGSIAVGVSAANDNLEIDIKFVFKPPAENATDADITVDYLGKRIRTTVLADPSAEGYLHTYTVNALAGLTAAQRRLLEAGWTVDVYVRPHETVGTDQAMVLGTCFWHYLAHLRVEPTLTVLA